MAELSQISMVGVARIELATPAMSTKRLRCYRAENRASDNLKLRTSREHSRFDRAFYRTVTAPLSTPTVKL